MHPMFIALFLDTGADDLLAEEETLRHKTKDNRRRMAARVTIRRPVRHS